MNKGKNKIKIFSKITTIMLAALMGIFSVSIVSAQERDFTFDVKTLTTEGQKQGYLDAVANGGSPLAAFIVQIINFIILISGSVSFLLIVVGGFMILSSAGNETSLNKGKDIIKIAIIGLVLTLSSYFIVAFVQGIVFGV